MIANPHLKLQIALTWTIEGITLLTITIWSDLSALLDLDIPLLSNSFYHQNFKFPIVFEALGHSQGLSGILRHIYNTMILQKLAYFKRPNRLVHHLLDLDI